MSFGHNLFRSLMQWPIRWLVSYQSLPENPLTELNLDPERPIVYALKTNSLSDLLTLQLCCQELGLPDPFSPLLYEGHSLPRYVCLDRTPPLFGRRAKPLPFLREFEQLLDLHRLDVNLDIQLVPITLFWGRAPGREGETEFTAISTLAPNSLKKAWLVAHRGRENRVRFSKPVSLRYMADHHGTDAKIAHKLARVARVHFGRQQMAATGPKLPNREQLFEQILAADVVQAAIAAEMESAGISEAKARARALKNLNEIASDFSYRAIKIGETVLGWVWNKIYRGLSVNGAERVRQLAQDGHEIVYVPCHRSHMDYLLLSYVIYHQGMVPPHVAAGVNLNFWPAGPIFRRGGAFFMRRTFKGDPLYSTLFREYLYQLFAKGYSVEYFTEGGRSRTGRLLAPKTGMIAMTLQAMLRGLDRPLSFVPVYIGYEHVMEVSTYHRELQGSRKERESFWQVLGIVRKLRNYGRGFVNFGEPLSLNGFLNEHVPDWDRDFGKNDRPTWLADNVNHLATELMCRVNSAAAVNGLTLCALALLAAERHALTRTELEAQLEFYLMLLRKVPYSPNSCVPDCSASELIDQALELNKFEVSQDKLGQIISISRYQAVLLTYYRNNIIHLLALPALVATLIERHEGISSAEITTRMLAIYPLLKDELFMHDSEAEIPARVEALLSALSDAGLIRSERDGYWLEASPLRLLLLAESIQETLQRYAIVLLRIEQTPQLEIAQLEADSQLVAERLGTLHGINAPEFFDAKLFSGLIQSLQRLGYLNDEGGADLDKVRDLAEVILPLIHRRVRRTIKASVSEAQIAS